jgi:hypothetical protein
VEKFAFSRQARALEQIKKVATLQQLLFADLYHPLSSEELLQGSNMSGNARDTSSTASGSRTTLVTQNDVPAQTDGLLRLRASSASNVESRRVIWSEDTVDNEHLGKKKSKSE